MQRASVVALGGRAILFLLWPGLFVLGRLVARPGMALRLLCLPLLIAPVSRLMTYKGYYPVVLQPLFGQFSFFNYFDCLAVGCISAILLRQHRKKLQAWVVSRPMLTAAGLAALAVPYLLAFSNVPGWCCPPNPPSRLSASYCCCKAFFCLRRAFIAA